MVARVLMDNGVLKVSKPGIDVFTATSDQLLLGAGLYPQMIIHAGVAAVASTLALPHGLTLPYTPMFIIQGTYDLNAHGRVPYYTSSDVRRWTYGLASTTSLTIGVSNSRSVFYAVLNQAQPS